MKVAGNWLDHPGTQRLLSVLEHAGHQALVVGGCVRNALLDLPAGDVDIATSALPETVTNLAETAGFKVVPTGLAHGTVTVVAEGRPHEVTTFRKDAETFGRHARVVLSAALEDDAARRDFTMNALYARRDGTVIDPLGGLPDLRQRKVRFVGDPDQRIAEDYLRILRFFRFHAHYADPAHGLDPEGLAACAAHVEGLAQLSRERIGAEMRKILSAPDPAPAVAAMAACGVLQAVLPGADPRALAVLVHLEAGCDPRWLRRLAVIGAADAEGALRLSRAEGRDLGHVRDEMGGTLGAAALGWRLGADLGQDAVLARAAVLEAPLTPGWRDEVLRGAAARFPVAASDLAPQLSGPALGARLKELERRWLDSDLRLGKADLLG